jgi:hypothetical protein
LLIWIENHDRDHCGSSIGGSAFHQSQNGNSKALLCLDQTNNLNRYLGHASYSNELSSTGTTPPDGISSLVAVIELWWNLNT